MVFAVYQHESATSVLWPLHPHPEPLSTSLPTLLLWDVPEHWLSCPASCIKLALVIYFTYGDVHVSMMFSQIIPPLPSLTESKSLFFHLCLLCCLHVGSSVASFYIPCICFNIQYLSFSFWLHFCIIGSRFIHLIRTDSNAFLFIAE